MKTLSPTSVDYANMTLSLLTASFSCVVEGKTQDVICSFAASDQDLIYSCSICHKAKHRGHIMWVCVHAGILGIKHRTNKLLDENMRCGCQ